MAITPVYLEGFDDGAVAAMRGGWVADPSGSSGSNSTTTGRTGSALRLSSDTSWIASATKARRIVKSMTAELSGSTHVAASLSVRPNIVLSINAVLAGSNAHKGFIFFGGGTGEIHVFMHSDGKLYVRDNVWNAGSTLGSSVAVFFSDNVWTSVQILIKQGAAGTGNVKAVVNGTTVVDVACSITGMTQFGLSATHRGEGSTSIVDFDDLWIGTATADNNVPEDCRVHTLFPSANGSSSQGIGSDGNSTDNYALVDETTVSSSDYVDLSTGETDLYNLQDLPFVNGTVYGVQVRSAVERTDTSSISARPVMKLGGNTTTGTSIQAPFGAVGHSIYPVQTTKPGGGTWTVAADVDNAEFGLEGV